MYSISSFFITVSLPDVASRVIALLHIILVVAALCVVVGEDDETNKVEFVLIHIMVNSLKHCTDIL